MGAKCKLQPPALGPKSQGPSTKGQQREDSQATLTQQGAVTATCQGHPLAPGCLLHLTPGPMAQTPEVPPLSPTGTAADCQRRRALALACVGWRATASRPASGQRWRPLTLTRSPAGGCGPAPHGTPRRVLHAVGSRDGPCTPWTQTAACRPHTALHAQRLNRVFFSAATGEHVACRPGPESGRGLSQARRPLPPR